MIGSAQEDLRLFVDALRGVLGFAPLYTAELSGLCFAEQELAAPEQDRGAEWFRGGHTEAPRSPDEYTRVSVARQRFKRLDLLGSVSGG